MNFQEYRERRQKWRLNDEGKTMPMWLAQAGVVGELGEVVDLIKKASWHGADIKDKLLLELGDVCWYVDEVYQQVGWNLNHVGFVRENSLMALALNCGRACGHAAVSPLDCDHAMQAVLKVAFFFELNIQDILQANIDKLEARYTNGFVKGGGNR